MRKVISILLLSLILFMAFPGVVHAQAGPPVGGCPANFELHEYMDPGSMDMDGHQHRGLKVDLNGDGWICMMMATDTNHVHIDNVLPLP